MLTKLFHWGIWLAIVAVLLSSCAPAQSVTPTATANAQMPPAPTPTTPAASAGPTATTAAGANPTNTASAASSGGVKYVLVADQSTAGFQVTEQLARNNLPNDAIGTTKSITGSITVLPDGTIDSANSKFTVDVSTLQTDQPMRDGYVKRNILQTDQYPQAVFVPDKVTGLPAALPDSGNLTFQVSGNLTIRNVTKPITWDVTGSIANGVATGKATTHFTFEDFSLTQPQVPVVLSVVDKITLNVSLVLQKAGG